MADRRSEKRLKPSEKGGAGVSAATSSIQSKPIKSTRLRRFLVLATAKVWFKCHRIFANVFESYVGILFIGPKLVIKCGPLMHLPEASTIQFVAQHTSIPVPKIYCAFKRKGRTYIVMERIDGQMLGQGWVQRAVESKAKILNQLRNMVNEMRRIPTPAGQGVSNIDGGEIFDSRIAGPKLWHGPWSNIHEFHVYLRGGFETLPNRIPEVGELIKMQDRDFPPPGFTHGDLSSLNILVRGDEIVGIIDWETAGWYPSYWEYTSACQVNPRNYFWRDEIEKFLDPMPEELRMETIRQKYFGDV